VELKKNNLGHYKWY